MSRLDGLAAAMGAVWCVGAALTHVIGIWAGVGGAAIGLGIAALVLARPILAPLLRPSGRLLAWGLGAAMLMLAVTYGAYPVLRQHSTIFSRHVPGLYALFRAAAPLWVTAVLLPFIIVAEELVWRGVVQEALRRRFAPSAAVVLGGIVYAVAHAPVGSPLLVLLALACGLFWSTLRAWTRSLIPGLVCHLIWDLLVFVLRPLV